jgi:hypothetical protein
MQWILFGHFWVLFLKLSFNDDKFCQVFMLKMGKENLGGYSFSSYFSLFIESELWIIKKSFSFWSCSYPYNFLMFFSKKKDLFFIY